MTNSRAIHVDFDGLTDDADTVEDMNRPNREPKGGRNWAHQVPRPIDLVGSASEAFDRLPGVSRIGLVLIGLAVIADIAAHTTLGFDDGHGGAAGSQLSAHAAIFLGMVLVLAGIVVGGARSTRRSHNQRSHAGRTSDAVR